MIECAFAMDGSWPRCVADLTSDGGYLVRDLSFAGTHCVQGDPVYFEDISKVRDEFKRRGWREISCAHQTPGGGVRAEFGWL
jgi:hypothetical protein